VQVVLVAHPHTQFLALPLIAHCKYTNAHERADACSLYGP
jgi:hypothetical protein